MRKILTVLILIFSLSSNAQSAGPLGNDEASTPPFTWFVECMTGPALSEAPYPMCCRREDHWTVDYDVDGDGNVDLRDFAIYQNEYPWRMNHMYDAYEICPCKCIIWYP